MTAPDRRPFLLSRAPGRRGALFGRWGAELAAPEGKGQP